MIDGILKCYNSEDSQSGSSITTTRFQSIGKLSKWVNYLPFPKLANLNSTFDQSQMGLYQDCDQLCPGITFGLDEVKLRFDILNLLSDGIWSKVIKSVFLVFRTVNCAIIKLLYYFTTNQITKLNFYRSILILKNFT